VFPLRAVIAQVLGLPLCPPKGTGPLAAIFHQQTLFHPLVVHFPIALWLTSALFDAFHVVKPDRFHTRVSQYLIGLGLLAALVSINLGFCDSIAMAKEGVGQKFVDRHAWHQIWALAATVFYAASFLIRIGRPAMGRTATIVLLAGGAVLIAVAGYLGGEVRLVM
jgi:uncharacterized membrane protein